MILYRKVSVENAIRTFLECVSVEKKDKTTKSLYQGRYIVLGDTMTVLRKKGKAVHNAKADN